MSSQEYLQSIYSSSDADESMKKRNRRSSARPKSLDITSDDISEITASSRKSYRDKLKDRFRLMKEKSSKTSNLKPLVGRLELMRIENRRIDDQINGRRASSRGRTPSADRCEISGADKFNFFCSSVSEVCDDVLEAEMTSKSTQLLVENNDDLLVNAKPENLLNEFLRHESEYLWSPSRFVLKQNDESPESYRNLEDEGLYIAKQPNVPENQLIIVQNRLLADGTGLWKSPSGKVSFIENPYVKIAYRPDNYALPNPIDVEFLKAGDHFETNLQSISIHRGNILEISICSIKFSHHHLFSLEHVLQEKLVNLYDTDRHYRSTNKIERMEKRLNALRVAKKNSLEENNCASQIKMLRNEMLEERRIYRRNLKDILQTWKAIKNLRKNNNFSNTFIKLIINKENCDYNDEKSLLENIHEIIVSELEEENDEELLESSKLQKRLDADEFRKRFHDYYKSPGEPNLTFSIAYDNKVDKVVDDQGEINRRNTVNSTKMYFELRLDNTVVCRSKIKTLNDSFTVVFDEHLNVQLANDSCNFVTVDLYEFQYAFIKKRMVRLDIAIPSDATTTSSKLGEMHFQTDDVILCNTKHSGVGASEEKRTSGFMTYGASWTSANTSSRRKSDAGLPTEQNLSERLQQMELDPQDPNNFSVFEYLKSTSGSATNQSDHKYFRCDPYLHSLHICSRQDLEKNPRFRLLQLRDRNEPEFAGMVVPNRIKEIPTNIFHAYTNRLLLEENATKQMQHEDDDGEHDGKIDANRSYGRKCLRQIHTKVFQLCRNTENNMTFDDVVNEQAVTMVEVYIKTALENLLNWFRLGPTLLKPLPTVKTYERETQTIIESSSPPSVNISVMSGFNIPTRKSAGELVQPFVEFAYGENKVRCKAAAERNCAWNEELKLSIGPINSDYINPNALKGFVSVNLYDCVDESECWLGSLQIPLSAVGEKSQLDGLFLIRTPKVLLGYDINSDSGSQTSASFTYVSMRMSMHPNVPKISPDMEVLQTNEPPYLKEHILDWNNRYNNDHRNRTFSALAIDSNGKSVCITRFLRSLELPQLNADGFDVTADQCAKYVSLIPFTDSNKFYQNIWLTTEQLLKLGLGSVIDHAVALTCFLITLKMDVWLVIGYGLPHGTTAYVLIREYVAENVIPNHHVYDVTTGQKYNVLDSFCPLKRIYCVVNEHNVWGNTQRSDNINTVRLDFSRRFDWLPLFNQKVTAPSSSIQQKLLFSTNHDIQQLQYSIEKKFRRRIAKMRMHERTIWNHYLSNAFRNTLSNCELASMLHSKSVFNFEEVPEIETFCKDYKLNGFVLNVPFGSKPGVIENAASTVFSDCNVEFALAIYLHPYPNQVLSVWIAFASISKILS